MRIYAKQMLENVTSKQNQGGKNVQTFHQQRLLKELDLWGGVSNYATAFSH
jgi:hypothetical protein